MSASRSTKLRRLCVKVPSTNHRWSGTSESSSMSCSTKDCTSARRERSWTRNVHLIVTTDDYKYANSTTPEAKKLLTKAMLKDPVQRIDLSNLILNISLEIQRMSRC